MKALAAEARIRAVLGQHRTDPGAGKLAAIADGDGGCGDDAAEHTGARAVPSKRIGHGVILRVAWLRRVFPAKLCLSRYITGESGDVPHARDDLAMDRGGPREARRISFQLRARAEPQ